MTRTGLELNHEFHVCHGTTTANGKSVIPNHAMNDIAIDFRITTRGLKAVLY